MKFDVVWSFDNSVFFRFDALPPRILAISHIVDVSQDFQTKSAAQTADICLGVCQPIVSRLAEYNQRSFFINHGFNLPGNPSKCQPQLPGDNQVKALYAGNLAMKYLDWNTIYDVVRHCPEVDFVFLGPGADDFDSDINETHLSKKDCHVAANTYFIGKVPADELQEYYSAADFLIVAYQERFGRECSNSHKLMEYFGSGTVPVATWTAEYQGTVPKGIVSDVSAKLRSAAVGQRSLV